MFFALFLALFLILWAILAAVLPLLWRLTGTVSGRIAHWITRNSRIDRWFESTKKHWKRMRAYGPILLIIAIGAGLTLWAGDAFLDLASLVRTRSSTLQQIDVHAHDWAIAHRTPQATAFFLAMTNGGGPEGCAVLSVVVVALLLIRKRFRWALYFIVTAGGGAFLNLTLKSYYARARPDVAEMLKRANGYSFPSGHAMGTTVVVGALSYLAFRTLGQWRWKTAALAFAFTVITAVALSRVYVGAHWLSDVAAGVMMGTVWTVCATAAYEVFRRVRLIRARQTRTAPTGVALP